MTGRFEFLFQAVVVAVAWRQYFFAIQICRQAKSLSRLQCQGEIPSLGLKSERLRYIFVTSAKPNWRTLIYFVKGKYPVKLASCFSCLAMGDSHGLDLNREPLRLEATALPTEPQPVPNP